MKRQMQTAAEDDCTYEGESETDHSFWRNQRLKLNQVLLESEAGEHRVYFLNLSAAASCRGADLYYNQSLFIACLLKGNVGGEGKEKLEVNN